MYTENMDKEEREEFDAMLIADPMEKWKPKQAPMKSRNVGALMGAFGMKGK